DLGPGGELVQYREKPSFEFLVSMGVNAFHKSALDFIPRAVYLDMPTLMINLKNAGKLVLTHRAECQWLDIGRPDDYEQALALFEQNRGLYLRESR
ncbi:MAG: nucleotidyltransferase family protein, partial [Phycisphaerae bacterium]|nr:nucleotidyltransferase family protein [Phycisphaerae bacterium]